MNNYEFYDIALDNIPLFFMLLFFSVFVHYLIYRKHITSFIDPLFVPIISSVFSLVVVYLLFITGNILLSNFISFNCTQIFFWLGLFVFKPIKTNNIAVANYTESKRNAIVAFYFFSVVYLITQCLIYYFKGIPIFKDSRLETFADGGGDGIMGRIIDVTSIFSIYSFFVVVKTDKFRISEIPKYFIMLFVFITLFLSGSKASFLNIFSVFLCYLIFAKIKGGNFLPYINILKKYKFYLLAICLLVVTLIIIVQNKSDDVDQLNPIAKLLLRFVHSGDVYWYAYPNQVYLLIKGNEGFKALFNDTLGLLRIYNWSEMPEAIGITLKNRHHPSDILEGANARHNVFGLIYYGYIGSVFFSFVLGFLISFVRRVLPLMLKNTLLNGFIFTFLMIKVVFFDTDPMLTITYINNLIFIFPFIYLLYLWVLEFVNLKSKI
jgi:hypothetical protein